MCWLAAARVSVIHGTPVLLRLLAEVGGQSLPDLRLVLSGGHRWTPSWHGNFPPLPHVLGWSMDTAVPRHPSLSRTMRFVAMASR